MTPGVIAWIIFRSTLLACAAGGLGYLVHLIEVKIKSKK